MISKNIKYNVFRHINFLIKLVKILVIIKLAKTLCMYVCMYVSLCTQNYLSIYLSQSNQMFVISSEE